jgi:8-oxo-dGTP pyrophosphatase MutT (NUDIX family)
MHEDELLDLVNDNDEVIGTIYRSEYDRMVAEKLGNIRAVELLIVNAEGKYWIPTRTAHKKIAPSGLDYSMGGHVGAGETYEESALREIQEELNLDLKQEDLEFVKKFPPNALPYFRSLYVYHSNEAPKFNPDDYVGAEWLSLEEIKEKLDHGVPAKVSIRETVDALLQAKA